MKTLLDVVKVSAKPGYLLELEFENGELRLFASFLSIASWLMKLHMLWLFTSSTGASPHAPMHSPSTRVNLPSGVVSPKPMPSLCLR